MKGYKRFILLIILLLTIYIVAELNRPEEIKWNVTMSSTDKGPFGAYILYQQLQDIFPKADIKTYHLPVYNQLNLYEDSNTAYVLIEPELRMSHEDIDELVNYVASGNYVFIASSIFNKLIKDTLKFATKNRPDFLNKDSSVINFKSPYLHAEKHYQYHRAPLTEYFNSYDTVNTIVLGNNQHNDANFIKMPYGDGAFFIHSLPLCFSNDFMLTRANAEYTAKALSNLPSNIHTLFWDEYYKQDDHGNQTPLRYILNNTWLRAAFYTGLVTILLFVLFEMKRRQRIIPVITPLRNSTLDFVRTVGNVYFNERDNKNIALKKINYFLESIRSEFYLSTSHLNEEFIQAFAKKIAIPEEEVSGLVKLIQGIQQDSETNDQQLLELNRLIDYFYSKFKS